MSTGNNIHLSEERFAELVQIAESQGKTPDELAEEAVAIHLRRSRLERLMAYGQRRAQELGIQEADVDRLIHEGRAERGSGGH